MKTVTTFSRYNLSNAAESLRLLAHQIESGELGEDVRCVVALEMSEGVTYRAFGPEPFTTTLAAGLCAAAQAAILGSARM